MSTEQPQEEPIDAIEDTNWKTFDETLQALSGDIPKKHDEFFQRAIKYVDYVWTEQRCCIVLKYLVLCFFVIVNISSLTLNVINLETRDSSEDYNLSTYIVAIVEFAMVYGCFISSAICCIFNIYPYYSYSNFALVCYLYFFLIWHVQLCIQHITTLDRRS